jgi:hypothetical protein
MADKSVPLFAPDGTIRMIPADQVDAALAAGGQMAIKMKDPQGTPRWVRESDIPAAKQAGGTIIGDNSGSPQGIAQMLFGDAPVSNTLSSIWDHAKNFVTGSVSAFTNPMTPQEQRDAQTTGGLLGPANVGIYRLTAEPTVNALRQMHEQWKAKNFFPDDNYDASGAYHPSVVSSAIDAVPVIGPMTRAFETERREKGLIPAAAGLATDFAMPAAASEALALPAAASRAAKEFIAPTKTLDRPIMGDPANLTPRERFRAARDMRVNLDAAQATGAAIPGGAKAVTENSLAGGSKFADNSTANLEALHWYADHLLNGMAPEMAPEDFGSAARDALLGHQKDLNERAGNLYEALDERLGDKHPDTGDIKDTAQKILDENGPYYAKHPELLKGGASHAWSILKDLSGGKPVEAAPPASTLIDPQGNPIQAPVQPKAKVPDTWSDLHRLRSDLMDIYRSPEVVGSRSEGWLKRMTGAIDQTMNSADKTPGMSDADQNAFRAANSIYERMKTNYDNPTSPFYSIIRTPEGLTSAQTLTNLKPQAMRDFREAMGDIGRQDLVDQQSRQVASKLLNAPDNPAPDLRNFPTRFTRAPKPILEGSLSPEQIQDLGNLASVSRAVHADINPSGSGKLVQKVGEASAIPSAAFGAATELATGHPVAAAATAAAPVAGMAAQRGLANASTSPAVVDSLMAPRPPAPPTKLSPVAVGQEAAGIQQQQNETYPELAVGTGSSTANQDTPPPDKPGMTPLSAETAPEGATHEVLSPDGKAITGHVVDGQYVPLATSGSQ